MENKSEIEEKKLRQFGWLLIIASTLGGVWLVLKGGSPFYSISLFFVFVYFTFFKPRVLTPLYKAWMALGLVLNFISTRIVLMALLYCVITPMSFVMKIFGKKFLLIRADKNSDTYWNKRAPVENSLEQAKKQY